MAIGSVGVKEFYDKIRFRQGNKPADNRSGSFSGDIGAREDIQAEDVNKRQASVQTENRSGRIAVRSGRDSPGSFWGGDGTAPPPSSCQQPARERSSASASGSVRSFGSFFMEKTFHSGRVGETADRRMAPDAFCGEENGFNPMI